MNARIEITIKKIPNILLNKSLLIECTSLAPMGAIVIVTGTKTKKPGMFTYPIDNGAEKFENINPLNAIDDAPKIEIIKPIAADVPIASLIGYPYNLMKGTPKDPPPIPRGTDIKPINKPVKLLIRGPTFFGFSPIFSLMKIKNRPTQNEKIENINNS